MPEHTPFKSDNLKLIGCGRFDFVVGNIKDGNTNYEDIVLLFRPSKSEVYYTALKGNYQNVVTACNNHDKLLQALEAIIHEGTRAINECKNSNVKAEYDIDKIDRIARQALKEVKG